jgi:hypothetical protein
MTPPIAEPCDSPKVVSLNCDPKVFPAIIVNIFKDKALSFILNLKTL